VQALEVLHRLLAGDELRGEGLRRLLVLLRLGLVARGPRLVGEHERLAGEPCSFSTSLICRRSFISSWRWLPMTAAACWVSRWWECCASSMACWIWIRGSACSSSLPDSKARKYFQPRTNGLAMSRAPR
jgi:hypothetical protein